MGGGGGGRARTWGQRSARCERRPPARSRGARCRATCACACVPHLGREEHVLDDLPHVRENAVEVHVQQDHQRLAHALAHLGGRVDGEAEEAAQVGVQVGRERLGHHLHELVDAGERHLAHVLVRRAKVGQESRDQRGQRGRARLQRERVGRVLADLVQRAVRALELRLVRRAEQLVEAGEELRPRVEAARGEDRSHARAHRRADERVAVAERAEQAVLRAPGGRGTRWRRARGGEARVGGKGGGASGRARRSSCRRAAAKSKVGLAAGWRIRQQAATRPRGHQAWLAAWPAALSPCSLLEPERELRAGRTHGPGEEDGLTTAARPAAQA